MGRRLRRGRLSGGTVRLKIRWSDFTTLTRQMRLDQPTDRDDEIYAAAETLLERVWQSRRPVRLIGVGVSGLGPPTRQLSLWEEAPDEEARAMLQKEKRLKEALDRLRERYGEQVVWWGVD